MRVLVTGSCGYVGSVLMRRLYDAGHEAVGLDIGWFGGEPQYKMDVRELKELPENTGAIIHLASIANDPSVDHYPKRSWETSVLATMRLAEIAARDPWCHTFIYASSVSVYGADRGKVTEDMDLKPLSDYNKTKMCAERVLLSYVDDLNVQIIRPATVCGLSPRMRLDVSVNMLTMQALTKHNMTVHGGSQMRPSIHIDDMCDLYVWMLEHFECRGIYNAGFENLSLMQMAHKVRAATGAGIEVTELRDARSYQVNSDKLLASGFRPKKTVDDAIAEIVAAYKAGALKDEPRFYNLATMKALGVKDE